MTSLAQSGPPLEEPEGFRLDQEPLEPVGLALVAHGELDIATAPTLRERIDAALAAGVDRLVIDLSRLTFLDSVAVAVLLQARRQLGEGGRMAIVVPPDSYARMVFDIAGLSHRLAVYAERDGAEAHARS